MPQLERSDRIVATRDSRAEAEKSRSEFAEAIVALSAQREWGVYVKPYRSIRSKRWSYAICIGRHDENLLEAGLSSRARGTPALPPGPSKPPAGQAPGLKRG